MSQNDVLRLQQHIIYGPVQSRRLGRSLGINLLSTKFKMCTFDCLYCQYGFRRISCEEVKNEAYYPSVEDVETALKETLSVLNPSPEYITFSGNGEATLHPRFPEIVDRVIQLRDSLTPRSRTAILSNSTEIDKPHIRNALAKLDEKIMKLDCGSQGVFIRYNRPLCSTLLEDIVHYLAQMEDITIQALFTGGKNGNADSSHIDAWIKAVKNIHPRAVQLYSLARGTEAKSLFPIERKQLDQIANQLRQFHIRVFVY